MALLPRIKVSCIRLPTQLLISLGSYCALHQAQRPRKETTCKSPGLITARLSSTSGLCPECPGRRHRLCQLQRRNRKANLVCKACVTRQRHNEATPVFHPCLRKCNEKVSYCGTHVGKIDSSAGLSHGDWDPVGGHPSMPPSKRTEGLRRARLRWDAAMRRDDVANCLRGNAFVDSHGTRAQHQRPYVSVDSESRGQLREWSRDAVPVAPFHCMLRDTGFATKLLWGQHVATHHVSLQWYRQRLQYLASRFDAV